MRTWSDTQAKRDTFEAIQALASSRQSQAEKIFWDDFKSLYPDEES
jgi:hypothetical protein